MSVRSIVVLGMLATACGGATAEHRATPTGFDLGAWISSLEAAVAADPSGAQAEALLGSLDRERDQPDDTLGESGSCDTPPEECTSEHLELQLDADPEEETVVRFDCVSPREGDERCERVWLGVFDPSGSGSRFLGSVRAIADHCLQEEGEHPFALTWSADAAQRALELTLQVYGSCGTTVQYSYTSHRLRVANGDFDVEDLGVSDEVDWGDRVEQLQEIDSEP